MTTSELIETAGRLEDRITQASSATRLALQPEFSRVLNNLRAVGATVPARFRRLDLALADEVVEARFDNMPV